MTIARKYSARVRHTRVRLDFDGTPGSLPKEYYHSGGDGYSFYKGDKEDDIKVSCDSQTARRS